MSGRRPSGWKKKGGISYAVLDLSDCLGYSIWHTSALECFYKGGAKYEEVHKDDLELWNNLSDDERKVMTDGGATFFVSEEEYERIGKEKIDSEKVPSHIRHTDIPYRAILAKLLKAVPDKKERIERLDYFYFNYNECASK
jgi:hypothetical protein